VLTKLLSNGVIHAKAQEFGYHVSCPSPRDITVKEEARDSRVLHVVMVNEDILKQNDQT